METILNREWACGCIDLETLATSADALVLEVGCVLFDAATGEMGPEYHAEVEMRAHDNRLRAVDAATWGWWGERMREGVDMPGMYGGISLWDALRGLAGFLKEHTDPTPLEMWAWGSDFDFAILRHAHDEAQMVLPWRYGRQCDARTFCGKLGVKRQGPVMHQALADARQEAAAVMEAAALLREMKGMRVALCGGEVSA